MSFQQIRAKIETKFAAELSVQIVYDNAQETPPNAPYARLIISYNDVTEPVLCFDGQAIENIRGNIQLSIYSPRGQGMGPLEDYATEGMVAMNTMYDKNAAAQVKCGQISGPEPVLSGDNPYALVTLSCPFTAQVRIPPVPPEEPEELFTNEVLLTNPLL